MKGQRLFVRDTTAADDAALRAFYASEELDPRGILMTDGVLARLVGTLVAHMTWEIAGNSATLTHVYVASAIRGKRIGRALLEDAVSIARDKGVGRLVVSGSCEARGFFLRTGFAEVGGELVREVS